MIIEDKLALLSMAVGALIVVLALVAWVLPQECRCPKCEHHVYLKKQAAEKKRAADHRQLHTYYAIKWGDPRCAQCRLGNVDDQLPKR